MFVNTTSYDMASMKEFMQSVTKKLMAAAGSTVKPEQIDNVVKSMVLTLDERTMFEVEDGMTRKISGKTVTTARAMGHNLQKIENKTITVTRAPWDGSRQSSCPGLTGQRLSFHIATRGDKGVDGRA